MMSSKDVVLDAGVEDELTQEEDEDEDEDLDSKKHDEHTKDLHLPCLLDTVVGPDSVDGSGLCADHLFLDEPYYNTNTNHSITDDSWQIGEQTTSTSLIIADETNSKRLYQVLSPCLTDHQIHTCDYSDAYEMCSKTSYYMIWFYLGHPVKPETLSYTSSIRYAAKTNRNTIIVGVTPTKLDVDLGLHGLVEIVVEPITKPYILTKYRRWTSLTIREETKEKDASSSEAIPTSTIISLTNDIINKNNNTNTTNNKTTACASSTSWVPTSEASSTRSNMEPPKSSSETTKKPRSSIKPQTFTTEAQKLNREAMAADHTTKEKLRRERIKDSCDQLRVLLPYIRGRKTDMASILEMTVDYLKLITSSLPPDFQTQIVAMMAAATGYEEPPSKDDAPRPANRRKRSTASPNSDSSPSASKVTSTSELSNDNSPSSINKEITDINGNITANSTRKPTSHLTSSPISYSNLKRTDSMEVTDIKPAKRMLMTSSNVQSPQSNMLYLTSSDDNRKDNCSLTIDSHDEIFPGHIQPCHMTPSHLYSEMDMMYSMGAYPPLSGPSSSRLTPRDRDGYGMFMDTYYHYYSPQSHSSGYGTNPLSDYVNPNAVLPVSYSSRLPDSSRGYDDNDRFNAPGSVDDVYLSLPSSAN